MKRKCIIVDDEPAAHYVLSNYIAKNPELELVHDAYNAIDALHYLEQNPVDLMFLDIDMPEVTGIEMLAKLAHPPRTILTTAYSEFALESYDYGVLDYLLKPIFYPRFVKAVERYFQNTPTPAGQPSGNGQITVKVDSEMVSIDTASILYTQSYGNYVKIFTTKKSFVATITTNDLEAHLPSALFMRAHKSHIIALDKIDETGRDHVVIKGSLIPIGITYKRELAERLKTRSRS